MLFGAIQRCKGTGFRIFLIPTSDGGGRLLRLRRLREPGDDPMARILLAESNELVALTIQMMLLSCSHEVVLARGAEEALRAFETQAFDLVFCDLHMKGEDGGELALVLRGLSADTRLILMTGGAPTGDNRDAHLDMSFLRTCRDAGKTTMLAKPFRMDQIDTLVRDQLAATTAAQGGAPISPHHPRSS